MGALVKKDTGQREGERGREGRQVKELRQGRKRGREEKRRGDGRREREKGNYAAFGGNWQVKNFERRDLQRRSKDLVTTKKDLRRIQRCGADKKLQNSTGTHPSSKMCVRARVRVRARVKAGEMLLIARLRGGSRQIALLFLSKKKVSCKKSILNYTSKWLIAEGNTLEWCQGSWGLPDSACLMYSWSCRSIIMSIN